jgi:hypothetical protein
LYTSIRARAAARAFALPAASASMGAPPSTLAAAGGGGGGGGGEEAAAEGRDRGPVERP